jgi:plastocyanin domain-containing protein
MSNPRLPALILSALWLSSLSCKKEAMKEAMTEAPPAPPQPKMVAKPAPAQPAVPNASGKIEVAVTEEGFVPSRISAKAGQPLVLAITRKTEKTCANEILFHGQEGKTDLPLNKTVEVTYVPTKSGPVKFGCAMGMMIGGVIDVSQ